jgi:hypothetical protein
MKLPKFLYLFKYPIKNRIQINLSKLFQNNQNPNYIILNIPS